MLRLAALLATLTVGLLINVPGARASTDEQRLAAHMHGAQVAFPACGDRLVIHLHADDALRVAYPNDPNVQGMGTGCEVWLRSGMRPTLFRFTLYHETYHTTHCGCMADHSPAMDRAVAEALRPKHPTVRPSRSLRGHRGNRRQGEGRIARF